MDIQELHIGQKACVKLSYGRKTFPMTITGIFSSRHNLNEGTVYLDFEGNEADVWEVDIKDIELVEE